MKYVLIMNVNQGASFGELAFMSVLVSVTAAFCYYMWKSTNVVARLANIV